MNKTSKSTREKCYEQLIKDLEVKYIGENTRHIQKDIFFRMLLHGMTEAEAKTYTKAKMVLIRDYHRL